MRLRTYILGILACGLFASCEKMNDRHEAYLKDGVIIYTAKVDSLKAFPGRNRVALSWLLVSDPKIDKCRVYWNSGRDSLNVPVQRTGGVDTIRVTLDNLLENIYTFEVYTYDNAGHSSVRESVIGTVYGANYVATLYNRPLRTAKYITASKSAQIAWFGISPQAVAVDIEYTHINGSTVSKREIAVRPDPFKPAAFADTTLLPNYKQGTNIRYRTAFKPVPTAIDTFFTVYDTQPVQ